MPDFGLIKNFDIDNGELDQLSPQQCFVLGYELAQIDTLLAKKEAICQIINADNRDRVEAACRKSGRAFKLKWMKGDVAEAWMQLDVSPL